MLRVYGRQADQIVEVEWSQGVSAANLVWLDLLRPTPEEDRWVETLLGITIPTQAEMQEIELSARLYREAGAEFLTTTALTQLDADEPNKAPVTFVLKDQLLVTIRYDEPKPFLAYLTHAQKPNGAACNSGEQVMLGLLEALVDRIADALEGVGSEIDLVSRDVFRKKAPNAKKLQHDLRSIIEQIGRKAELLTLVQESLVSIARAVAYHTELDESSTKDAKESRHMVKLIQRDAVSLGEHAGTLSNKITFLLDATLGLINLEQNQIIKIVSVAALVFLPPTLVASIYGMNFVFMPELQWYVGYPFALGLMVLSAVLPYFFFKRRGWL